MNLHYPVYPDPITPEQFDAYCKGPFRNVLKLLSLPMSATGQKIKQAAARALNWSCFEAIQAHWMRSEHILGGIWLENCPQQHDRLTIKALNILFIFDPHNSRFVGISLRPGEEGRTFDLRHLMESDEDVVSVALPKGALPIVSKAFPDSRSDIAEALDSRTFPVRCCIPYSLPDEQAQGWVEIVRNGEGLSVDVYLPDEEEYGGTWLMFSERQHADGGEDLVRQDIASPVYPGDFGVTYQWLRPDSNDDLENTLVALTNNGKNTISDTLFATPKEAIDAVRDELYGVGEDDIRDAGGVLIERTLRIVPSPF